MKRRQPKKLKLLTKGIILCEGQTEEIYFGLLLGREDVKRKFAKVSIQVFQPEDYSPLGIVSKAIEIKKENSRTNQIDFIWCVFDRDNHSNIPEAFSQASSTNSIYIAFSSICFEFWIYLHFDYSSRPYTDCYNMEHAVKNKFKDYHKTDKHSIETIIQHLDTARRHAKLLAQSQRYESSHIYERAAYTDVHLLIDFLLGE
ncbi:MAG: RloB family protein [Candidatus Kapaibacterium sp.]